MKDRYNSIIFDKGRGRDVYLVGGYVRDILRSVQSHDRDFIVRGDSLSFACEIRNVTGGTLVKFKSEDTVRLALHSGLTFDFCRPQGRTLTEDLSRRDFSINAMAWSPASGVVDPFNGIRDMQKKRIRTLGRSNLIVDPLRMLRAYRFAAEIGGYIERRTRHLIKPLHGRIKRVAPERITLEFFHLLNSKQSGNHLKAALADGILNSILVFPFKHLERNIRAVCDLEKVNINLLSHSIKASLNEIFAQNLTCKGLLCLETLLCDHMPPEDSGHRLTMSHTIRRRLELACRGLKEFGKQGKMSKARLFNSFMRAEEASVDVLILKRRYDLFSEYRRLRKLWKDGYLNADEIMEVSGITGGPDLGKIISSLRKAEFEMKVKSKSQAIKFIEEYTAVNSEEIC